jgi:hypothetical protein
MAAMDSGNGLMSAIIAVRLRHADICCHAIQQVASTRSTTGHRRRVRGVCRLASTGGPLQPTVPFSGHLQPAAPRGADGVPWTGSPRGDLFPRRCQRTVGPANPQGQASPTRTSSPRATTPASTRHARSHRQPRPRIRPTRASLVCKSELCKTRTSTAAHLR